MKFINKIMFTLLYISSIHLGAMDNQQLQKELDEKMEQLKQSMQEYQEQLNADLLDAAKKGNLEQVKQLIENGADVNTTINKGFFIGATALHLAVDKGHIDIVQQLINHKDININIAPDNGGTALHWAAEKDYTEIIKILVNHKNININTAPIGHQLTALHFAVTRVAKIYKIID